VLMRTEMTRKLQTAFEPDQAAVLTEVITEAYADLVKTSDFNELKAIVKDLAEAQQRTELRVEELAQAQQRTELRVEELAQAQQRTEQSLAQLSADVRALTSEVRAIKEDVRELSDWQRGEAGRREGERYERNMVQQAFLWFNGGEGDSPSVPAVRQHLHQILLKLDTLGSLTEEQNPLLADLIWRRPEPVEGWKDEHYAVVEISRHVNGHDITRAARRAATLEAAGVQAIGIVIGQHWGTADTRDEAIDQAVQWRVGDDLSDGYLAFCRRPA